jgi:hypothetical protein
MRCASYDGNGGHVLVDDVDLHGHGTFIPAGTACVLISHSALGTS